MRQKLWVPTVSHPVPLLEAGKINFLSLEFSLFQSLGKDRLGRTRLESSSQAQTLEFPARRGWGPPLWNLGVDGVGMPHQQRWWALGRLPREAPSPGTLIAGGGFPRLLEQPGKQVLHPHPEDAEGVGGSPSSSGPGVLACPSGWGVARIGTSRCTGQMMNSGRGGEGGKAHPEHLGPALQRVARAPRPRKTGAARTPGRLSVRSPLAGGARGGGRWAANPLVWEGLGGPGLPPSPERRSRAPGKGRSSASDLPASLGRGGGCEPWDRAPSPSPPRSLAAIRLRRL